jgi:hypothetical protein
MNNTKWDHNQKRERVAIRDSRSYLPALNADHGDSELWPRLGEGRNQFGKSTIVGTTEEDETKWLSSSKGDATQLRLCPLRS